MSKSKGANRVEIIKPYVFRTKTFTRRFPLGWKGLVTGEQAKALRDAGAVKVTTSKDTD